MSGLQSGIWTISDSGGRAHLQIWDTGISLRKGGNPNTPQRHGYVRADHFIRPFHNRLFYTMEIFCFRQIAAQNFIYRENTPLKNRFFPDPVSFHPYRGEKPGFSYGRFFCEYESDLGILRRSISVFTRTSLIGDSALPMLSGGFCQQHSACPQQCLTSDPSVWNLQNIGNICIFTNNRSPMTS